MLGLSVVKLIRIKGNAVHVGQLDILDETPVLDIKPYAPQFDHRPDARIGWFESAEGKVSNLLSDKRFG